MDGEDATGPAQQRIHSRVGRCKRWSVSPAASQCEAGAIRVAASSAARVVGVAVAGGSCCREKARGVPMTDNSERRKGTAQARGDPGNGERIPALWGRD